MKPFILTPFILVVLAGGYACQKEVSIESQPLMIDQQLQERATRLAHEWIIFDAHIDVPFRLSQKIADISQRTDGGDFDYPRAREGGLNAAFMAIYIPPHYQKGGAKALADELILMVEGFSNQWPERFTPARSVAEIRANFAQGKISLPMGIENGAPLEGNLENLNYYYRQGIRYLTLTHSRSNQICDSSGDPQHQWNGLSPFGKQVVLTMNHLGMMIDVSHASDETFFQVMQLSAAPVIASHSSCRRFTPGWERNMSDAMLLQLKENGGVIQINFGSSFLNNDYLHNKLARERHIDQYLDFHNLQQGDEAARQYIEKYHQENPLQHADVSDVVDHIDHVVELIGVDHVGLGSDFDGVGDSLPNGLKDVSGYPNLIYQLLKRGYSEVDIEKICSGNLLRVWSEVERIAQQLQTKG
ncbi:MAG: dipeptidase [Dehalococcoidia bacterium]